MGDTCRVKSGIVIFETEQPPILGFNAFDSMVIVKKIIGYLATNVRNRDKTNRFTAINKKLQDR